MPKKSKYPKLRVSIKRGKAGQVWHSWFYDMRGTGTSPAAIHRVCPYPGIAAVSIGLPALIWRGGRHLGESR